MGEEAKSLTPLFMGVHLKNRVMNPHTLSSQNAKAYDIINHHFALSKKLPTGREDFEFYNQAYFIKNMFTSQNLSRSSMDIATRVEAIADAEESHMVDRWAHTNASSIAGFTWEIYNQPILQIKVDELGGTEKLKKQILQHTLVQYALIVH